jgi:hypothetical protein
MLLAYLMEQRPTPRTTRMATVQMAKKRISCGLGLRV